MTKPKILVIDIETCPLESYTWGLWEQNVGVNQIKVEWSILSYAAKWLNERKIIYQDTGGRGKAKVRDDKTLLGEIWKLLDQADIVVGQNVQRFDVKKINSRLILNGFPPYSPIRVVDTLLSAKRRFAFTSNKLEWISQNDLTKTKKRVNRKFAGFDLWKECLNDNPAAWKEMKLYNCDDVKATEEYYAKLRPWIDNHPNMGGFTDSSDSVCPKCGSADQEKRGFALTNGGKYQRYQCLNCGGWSRGKVMLMPLDKRRSLLV